MHHMIQEIDVNEIEDNLEYNLEGDVDVIP